MADDKKIIIDEDWKSQVEREKEEAAKSQPADAEAAAPSAAKSGDESTEVYDPPMPPASLELLLSTLATEALVALGQVPHPGTGQTQLQRNQAKFLIDTIEVLKQKTAGNLTAEEQEAMDGLLHQMRMIFVQTAAG